MKSKVLTIIFAIILLLGSTKITNAEEPNELEKTSISDFLTPDGRIDLKAARMVGFQGSLNLEGYDIHIDPKSSEPIVLPAGISDVSNDPDDQYWHDMSVPTVGMNSDVVTLTIYNGDLVAGGAFTNAGGIDANHIARWDGITWQPFGSGINGVVYSLTVYDGELIAGGAFKIANGAPADGHAQHAR